MSEADPANPSFVQNITAVNGFAYGVIGADIHIFASGLPLYLLANWDPAVPADPDWLRELPSRMLNARRAIVPFTGRDSELQNLRQWRDGGGGLAARWLYGPGGQGKTRLAAQFAADSAAAGWKVITAFHGPDADEPEPGSQDMTLTGARGLLVIIDYADRWLLTNLTWLLKNALLHQAGVPTRVLMLARTADSWPRIRGVLDNYQARTSSHPLRALAQENDERTSMFATARDSFAAIYRLSGMSAVGPPGPLDDPEFGLTLAIHMAALVSVDAQATGQRPPQEMAGLTMYLLDREQLHWARLYADASPALDPHGPGFCTPPEVMNQVVFAAALTGNIKAAEGTDLLEHLEFPRPAQALRDHAVCYPASNFDSATVLEPLYPDRLAEDFLALTLPGHLADYPAQTWAGLTTATLLGRQADRGAPASWTARALTFLSAAAQRWPHLGTGYLYPLLKDDPQLAVDAGNATLTNIANLPDADQAVLEAIEDCLPKGRHADLDPGIAAVVWRATSQRLLRVTDPAARARMQVVLGWRLAFAGQAEQALAATEEATRIYRQLAGSDAPADLSALALALDHLGTRLTPLGRHEDALAATTEAVQIRRRLVSASPGYSHLLAESLNNLGNRYSSAGRLEEALTAGKEAVEIRRRLAATDAATEQDSLATELHNLGIHLSKMERRVEALAVAEEAVQIRRQLATADPAAHEPSLASELNDLGLRQAGMGLRQEALSTAEEAVQVFRRMTEKNPLAFEQLLARAINNHGQCLARMGWREDALAAAEETAQIRRRLAAANPAAFDPELAETLNDLCAHLASLGRPEEALTAAEEAVQIRRRLMAVNPARFTPFLAVALNGLGLRLAELGRRQEALDCAEESVQILRQLTAANPATYSPPFAGALGSLANRLSDLGRSRDALPPAQEAADVLRRLAAANPAAFEHDFAAALNNLGLRLADLGHRQEALSTAEKVVQIRRRLATANPAAFESDLPGALNNLGLRLADLGHHQEALSTAEESVRSYRRLATANPATFEPGLALGLNNLGLRFREARRYEDALAVTREAVAIYQRLAAVNPGRFQASLAASLNSLGLYLAGSGDHEQALAADEQAVHIYRQLARANPARFEPNLGKALNNLGKRQWDLGQREKALATTEEAVKIRQRLAAANPAVFKPDLAMSMKNLQVMLSNLGRRKQPLRLPSGRRKLPMAQDAHSNAE